MKSKLYIQALAQVALQGLKTVKIGLAQVASQAKNAPVWARPIKIETSGNMLRVH